MITISLVRFVEPTQFDGLELIEKARRYHPELGPQWRMTNREVREYLGSVYGFRIEQNSGPFEATLVFDDPEKELLFKLKYL